MRGGEIELLAPAGKPEVLEAVAAAGADAVYLGGKRFNMRALRYDFNFSDRELTQAVRDLHQIGKKLYVTVNNLYFDRELGELSRYLVFLQEIGVDALIIQDLAVARLHRELGLTLPLHTSVQMGLANSKAVDFFAETAVTRVILSKNLTLSEIRAIHEQTALAIEFFAHGDLCVSHAGQCYMSSFIAGESGNRGRCVKPCRWPYQTRGLEHEFHGYLLAYNDLCLLPYLQDLVEAGVFSFKIEGRMRSAEYLQELVGIYRIALDRVLSGVSNPEDQSREQAVLNNRRVRDFTSGNLLGRPEADAADPGGEREPFFPTAPRILPALNTNSWSETNPALPPGDYQLTVTVGNLPGLKNMLPTAVDTLVLPWGKYRTDRTGWDLTTLDEALLIARESGKQLVVETPRIVTESQLRDIRHLIHHLQDKDIQAVEVNDYGSLQLVQEAGLPVWAGWGLNTSNSKAVAYLREAGVRRISPSLELCREDLDALLASGELEVEIMVQGPLCAMISDMCIFRTTRQEEFDSCSAPCMDGDLSLEDALGQHYPVKTDYDCRSHIFYPRERSLFALLPSLAASGAGYFRIDGRFYNDRVLGEVAAIYLCTLKNLQLTPEALPQDWKRLLGLFPEGLTWSPLQES